MSGGVMAIAFSLPSSFGISAIAGIPEAIAEVPYSYTGQYLKHVLQQYPPQPEVQNGAED
ncbi:hypothetical protein H6G20_17665 [Desertifilum sp. FACHB-1129]|uniref:Uncharacterized protein n=1 Tax=Desertifilum tharense IPPAS B-1220 TaxID=1781255 RepID=A0ACD5GM59_9CYAN|nr:MULTISPECIES: hypothetical protein [Desertifilum]MBD2313499.1 hypothetical protein [Desertifilum sp. FACHB-1129]MBD2322370.1 hypothetical protein [Desertifilum sp. FACHB-866]MBD2332532.1 hypothetical protein [Desertifilum sp. FACHB-868]